METFKKLLFLLSSREQNQVSMLFLMILVMTLIDVLGIASILPFIAVLTNINLIETNYILSSMFQFSKKFGIENNQQFLFTLGVLVFLLLVSSIIFKALTTYIQVRFVQMREYSISKRLVEGYLHQPYTWFLNQNSADIGKTVLSEVGYIIGNGIRPSIDLVAKSVISISLIVLLIIVDPELAFVVGILLGGAYSLIFYFIHNYLNKIGIERLKNNKLRYLIVNEAFGASKEVKVSGTEQSYINQFSTAAKTLAKTQAYSAVIGLLPRYILEIISFGGILLLMLFVMAQTGSLNNSLPILSLYIFAGYRLMPALQSIYDSLTKIAFISPSLNKLYYDLKQLQPPKKNMNIKLISFNKAITLKNIYYKYPNTTLSSLKNISLNIKAKSTVGIVGTTGSGKTTTVDIILGLLEAQKGTLEVDGKIITQHNTKAWQRSIGYVPQQIFLSDNTISANIAFGVESKYISKENVEKVCKIANLDKFVSNELPNKYETIIGERGVRLSGGQRQRIGIARALYHNPRLLIFDEATNALDEKTEQAVLDAVNNLKKQITMIIITHRFNTLRNCDKIFKINKGEIINEGNLSDFNSIK